MSAAVVVIPWWADSADRWRALRWCIRRYGVEMVQLGLGGEPWVKARAVMPHIEATDADIVVVADADVWTDGLEEAIEEVELGAPWAVPHLHVHRLSREGTEAVLGGAEWRSQRLEEPCYPGVVGGGYVVARRDVLLEAPMDPRFVGWGQDDEAWGVALSTLFGEPWRGTADLVHLWHPPQARLSRGRGNKDSWTLRRRYVEAMRDFQRFGTQDSMRQLLGEATDALHTDKSSLHDRTALDVG